jgi:hypothetical protein
MDSDSPKVTLNAPAAAAAASPRTQEAPAAPSPGDGTIVDAKGRKLTLRELTLLEEQDMMAAMPESHCQNRLVLGRALLVAQVATINGDPVDVPLTPAQYRAMLHQVGKESLEAVSLALAARSAGEDEVKDKAKN